MPLHETLPFFSDFIQKYMPKKIILDKKIFFVYNRLVFYFQYNLYSCVREVILI